MRKMLSFKVTDCDSFITNLLFYSSRIACSAIFTSNGWEGSSAGLIAGIDTIGTINSTDNSFEAIKQFHEEKQDWLFGFLSYDLKNEVEVLSSGNYDGIGFPSMHFFRPKFVFIVKGGLVEIYFIPEISSEKEIENLFHEISGIRYRVSGIGYQNKIKTRISSEEYIRTVRRIKDHIQHGDIYEMNYCMEFYSEQAEINPSDLFIKLNETSQAPFSAFFRLNDTFLLCASPERFLKKSGKKIISQPIKGTAPRGKTIADDLLLKDRLLQNNKERSENVMIVDLVRNDLSRTCERVKVDELFGVYTFRHWHQMISTVSGEIKDGFHFSDVLKNSFPMGSMTGAPKIKAMELIEHYEKTKRGMYSGAVGYITPDGDFDFNVVIRSILYNAASKYLSFQAGSAITANSIPEKEYEECLLKANGMLEALGISSLQKQRERKTREKLNNVFS